MACEGALSTTGSYIGSIITRISDVSSNSPGKLVVFMTAMGGLSVKMAVKTAYPVYGGTVLDYILDRFTKVQRIN